MRIWNMLRLGTSGCENATMRKTRTRMQTFAKHSVLPEGSIERQNAPPDRRENLESDVFFM